MMRLGARDLARTQSAALMHAFASGSRRLQGAAAAPSLTRLGAKSVSRFLHASVSTRARKKAAPASAANSDATINAAALKPAEDAAAAAAVVPPPRRSRKARSTSAAAAAADSPALVVAAVVPPAAAAAAAAPALVCVPALCLPDYILGLDVNTRSIGWVVVRVAGGPVHEASGWIDLAKISGLHAKAEEVERRLTEIKRQICSNHAQRVKQETTPANSTAAAPAASSSASSTSPVFLVVIESYLRMLSGSASFQLKHLFTLAELHALTCWLCHRTLDQTRIEHVHPTSPRAFFGIKKPAQPRSIEEEALWIAKGGASSLGGTGRSTWDPTLMEQENAATTDAADAAAAAAEEDAEFIAAEAAAAAAEDAEADDAADTASLLSSAATVAASLDENGLPLAPPKLSAKVTKQALALSLSIKSSVFAFLTTPQWAATPLCAAAVEVADAAAVDGGSAVSPLPLNGAASNDSAASFGSSLSSAAASPAAAAAVAAAAASSPSPSPSPPSPASFFPTAYPWRYLGLKRVKAVKPPKIKKARVSKKANKGSSATEEAAAAATTVAERPTSDVHTAASAVSASLASSALSSSVDPTSAAASAASSVPSSSAAAAAAASPVAPVGRFCPTNFDVSDAALLALYQWHRLQLEQQQAQHTAAGATDTIGATRCAPVLSSAASAAAAAGASSPRRFQSVGPVSRAEREASREFFRERARRKRDAAADGTAATHTTSRQATTARQRA